MIREFDQLLQAGSGKYKNKIKSICNPLYIHFGVSHFSYHKIMNSGHYIFLSSYPEWVDHYFSENYSFAQPHFRHPDFFKSGISFPRSIKQKEFQQVILEAAKFNVNFSLIFIKKHKDYVELIGFDLDSSDEVQLYNLLNNINLLKLFINQFVVDNSQLIKKIDEKGINLAEFMGPSFYQPPSEVLQPKIVVVDEFMKDIGLAVTPSLSQREKEVMLYLIQGCSYQEIGSRLFLSKRTIENYIERIKNKLNCLSKSELIQLGRELESIGYLTIDPVHTSRRILAASDNSPQS